MSRRPLALALLLAALLPATSARATSSAQPVLGLADRGTVIMGAAPQGAPGETWAYRQLPLDVPLLSDPAGQLVFGPIANPLTPSPQLVFERTSDATDGIWSAAQTPLDEHGDPYRGPQPNAASARITPHGGGVLVGRDSARPAASQTVVLVRDPDPAARFAPLPAPPVSVVDPGVGEALAPDQGAGHVALAAYDTPDHVGIFLPVVSSGPVQDAIAHWDGSAWSREPIDVPASSGAHFKVIALAATAPGNAYLLAETDPANGDGIVLFARASGPGGPHWVQQDLGAPLFAAASTPASGVQTLGPLDGDGQQPLSANANGVWIDGAMTLDGGKTSDLTLFFSAADAKVTGSWCDATAPGGAPLCDHPLGFRFGRRAGYRSFAFDGAGFGARVVTNPLDPGGDDTTNGGAWERFDGTTYTREPGAGGDFHASGGFSTPDRGWLEGPVQVTDAPAPAHLASWPVSLRSPLLAVATAPGGAPGALATQAIAVGAAGGVLRYKPGTGWQREFLLTSTGAVSAPLLRGVAWPDPDFAYAVGDLGAMWLWRRETGLWEKDAAAPIAFDGNLMGIAFDGAGGTGSAQRGYAVGRDGVLLAYGKSWTQEPLPAGFAHADFLSVAFAGHQALVAADRDVLVNDGDGAGWHVDAGLHALLARAPSPPRIVTVAGLPDGGAIAAGRGVVFERDSASAPWRPAAAPLPGATAIAAAALRDGDHVRAIVSISPDADWPPPTLLPPPDPDVPPPLLPPFQLPGDGYVLRETASGWSDEQRADYAGVANDKPIKADPVNAFALDPASGVGWAVGGWSGEPDNAGRGSGAPGPGAAVRARVQTAAVDRYAASGAPDAPPGETASPVPLDPALVTFAVAGHADCDAPCSLLANIGLGPDRSVAALGGALGALNGRSGAPRALLYTGGRLPVTSPITTPLPDEQRLASLLGQVPLPVYGAVSAADSRDGAASAFRDAFAPLPAPFGTAAAPASVAPVDDAASAGAAGTRTHYAFDSSGPSGTVRVIVIDNSAGSLAASDPYQVPAEPQEPWLRATLQDANAKGIPAIVLGSRDLNTRFVPRSNVASDGDQIAKLLVDEGASAYLYERPEEQRIAQIPAGAQATIPEYGTGTLGYRSPLENAQGPGQADSLFGDSGYLLVSLDAAKRDPQTNRAPVAARLIPLVQDVSLAAVDGTLLRRSRPALFQGIGRRPLAGDRWGPLSAADGSPNPSGADPYTDFPPALCKQANCGSRLVPEYRFTSADPDFADFVAVDPNTTNLRKPLQGANGKVVTDPTSGLLCAFNPGTTTLTVSAGGVAFSEQVTVQAGSVQQPCGTRPLSPGRFKHVTQPSGGASSPPPAVAPNVAASPAPAPPPPPPPASAPPKVPVPVPPLPLAAAPLVKVPGAAPPVPVTPPPPVASFARPIPPGGAVVRVYEEKREEEVAPEQQSAFSLYRPEDHVPLGPALMGLALLAALAGATLTLGVRRRERHRSAAFATARERRSRTRYRDPPWRPR